MDAKTYPLQDILKPERRYVIPTFQRDYEWTLDGQWRLLFEDLASTADRLLEVRLSGEEGSKLKAKEQSVSPHFLGAIVCAGLPFATGGVALRSVTSLRTIWLMHTSPGRSTVLYLAVGTSLPTLDHRVAGFRENLHVSKDPVACLLIQGDFTAP